MVGSGGQRGRGATILLALLMGAAALARPATAAADDASQLLPGVTVTAVTLDLDRDGDREIVRVVQEDDAGLEHAADAWEYDGAQWSMVGSVALPRATADQEIAGGLARALLLWRDGGRQRVLVLSAELLPGDPSGAMCCLTISELHLSRGGDLELSLLQRLDAGAQSVWSADMDGDGSDELVLHQGLYGATEDEQTATMQVLHWDGTTFESVFEQTDRELLYGFAIGDTDGVAGEDLLIGPGSDGVVRRLAWAGGEIRVDEAPLDTDEPPDGWVVGVADGAIVVSLKGEARVLRWPRDEAATTLARLETLEFPGISLVGDGADALIIVQAFGSGGSPEPTVAIHDLGLRFFGEVDFSLGGDDVWGLVSGQVGSGGVQHNIYPYSGPIHGGVGDDRAAYVSNGMLIQPGGPDGYEARPVASLIGVQPIGLAGPADAWLALGGNYSPPPGVAYLNWGGVPPEWGRLVVMPLDQLLQPDDQARGVSVELVDAVETAFDGGQPTLMADGDGFQVAITAPEGSVVIVMDGPLTDEHEVGAEPLVVAMEPWGNRQDDENQEFERTLLIVTPDGRGISRQWAGTFVRELPEISVSGSTVAMALSATLSGRASPGSRVNADGVAIETDDDGRFTASIDAPIWPSRVLVTARDPLGNEATEAVEVVGLVDYRGLPWAAILVAATLVVGAVLYVRTPKRRSAVSVHDGDGRLEELELDAVDGSEPGGR